MVQIQPVVKEMSFEAFVDDRHPTITIIPGSVLGLNLFCPVYMHITSWFQGFLNNKPMERMTNLDTRCMVGCIYVDDYILNILGFREVFSIIDNKTYHDPRRPTTDHLHTYTSLQSLARVGLMTPFGMEHLPSTFKFSPWYEPTLPQ